MLGSLRAAAMGTTTRTRCSTHARRHGSRRSASSSPISSTPRTCSTPPRSRVRRRRRYLAGTSFFLTPIWIHRFLYRCRSGQDPEIIATIQRGLRRALGRHHRTYRQTASGQAAVRHFRRTPRARPCHASARRRRPQGRERTHYTCE